MQNRRDTLTLTNILFYPLNYSPCNTVTTAPTICGDLIAVRAAEERKGAIETKATGSLLTRTSAGVGAPLPIATVLVCPGAGGARQGIEFVANAGEDLVPESAVQVQTNGDRRGRQFNQRGVLKGTK